MSNRTIHHHKFSLTTLFASSLTILTALSILFLSSSKVSADSSSAVDISVTVPASCSITTSPEALSTTIQPGGDGKIGDSYIKAICNDAGGLAIYAIGYTGDIHGDNNLRLEEPGNTLSATHLIPTGAAASPTNSQWNMTVAADTSAQSTFTPTIPAEFQATHIVPTTQAQIASYPSTTDQTTGVNIKVTYNAHISVSQAAGTYKGKVKYTLVHPSLHAAPASRPATLDTGITVNAKMKSLAAGSTKTYQDTDNLIKSIDVHTNTSAPSGFTASDSNTISSSTSESPIYIVFDNTNDAGVMHFYTEGDRIVLPEDSSYMFSRTQFLSDLTDLSDWDSSNVTNMRFLFFITGVVPSTFSLDVTNWDTSKVTDMTGMFVSAGYSATTWSIGDLSGWDTSKVTNMEAMLSTTGTNATTWSVGDLSGWNTSRVTNMGNLFFGSGTSATTWSVGDLSGWDTSNVTNMFSMFQEAGYSDTDWSIGDISGWDTSKVTSMDSMFYSAGYNMSSFSLDLSGWDTSSLTDMSHMFYEAGYNATTFSLDLSGWDTSKVTRTYYTNMDSAFTQAGYSASAANWTVIIPSTNGGGINNTTSYLYGSTTSDYAMPDSGKSFTLAQ